MLGANICFNGIQTRIFDDILTLFNVLIDEVPSCFEHGFEYDGAYLETHLNVVSAKQCHNLCQKVVRCVAFTWNSNGTLHQCDLKETVVSRQIMILHPIAPVSGPKYCPGDINDKQSLFYYFPI